MNGSNTDRNESLAVRRKGHSGKNDGSEIILVGRQLMHRLDETCSSHLLVDYS